MPAKGGQMTLELTRAQWDTAYIDNLPDSAFLYVEPGGKKDGDGKTVPRSLRHFPVRDAEGDPDPAHIRDALSRIPQSNLPSSVKAAATRKAQDMLKSVDSDMDGRSDDLPPRDSLVRASLPFELERSTGSEMPILHGVGAIYDEWTEINSRFEGHFMERFAPGSFAKTINEQRDRIRCLFHHGQDPSIGYKPLGTITDLAERGRGVEYAVDLFPADYVRSLVPGLDAGVYGSSFRFGIVKKDDQRNRVSNQKGLLERTIREASMRELGPTPFPAYTGTSAGLRSITDEFVLGRFPAEHLAAEAALRTDETDLVGEMRWLAERFIASDDTDTTAMRSILDLLAEVKRATEEEVSAPSTDAAPTGTSRRSAATTPSIRPLRGPGRDRKADPTWRL